MLPSCIAVAIYEDHRVFGGNAQHLLWVKLNGPKAVQNISTEMKEKSKSLKKDFGMNVNVKFKPSDPVEIFKIPGQFITSMCINNTKKDSIVVC